MGNESKVDIEKLIQSTEVRGAIKEYYATVFGKNPIYGGVRSKESKEFKAAREAAVKHFNLQQVSGKSFSKDEVKQYVFASVASRLAQREPPVYPEAEGHRFAVEAETYDVSNLTFYGLVKAFHDFNSDVFVGSTFKGRDSLLQNQIIHYALTHDENGDELLEEERLEAVAFFAISKKIATLECALSSEQQLIQAHFRKVAKRIKALDQKMEDDLSTAPDSYRKLVTPKNQKRLEDAGIEAEAQVTKLGAMFGFMKMISGSTWRALVLTVKSFFLGASENDIEKGADKLATHLKKNNSESPLDANSEKISLSQDIAGMLEKKSIGELFADFYNNEIFKVQTYEADDFSEIVEELERNQQVAAMLAEPTLRAVFFHKFKEEVIKEVGNAMPQPSTDREEILAHIKIEMHKTSKREGAKAAASAVKNVKHGLSAGKKQLDNRKQEPRKDLRAIYQCVLTSLADARVLANEVQAESKVLNEHKTQFGKLRQGLFGFQTRSVDMLQDQILREMKHCKKQQDSEQATSTRRSP